jgi:hypothetical protein
MNKQNIARRAALRERLYGRDQYVSRARHHKFAIGQVVALMATPGIARPKEMERDLLAAHFEILRLLPEQDHSLQYRVKDTVTGQERIVAEESILTKDPGEAEA